MRRSEHPRGDFWAGMSRSSEPSIGKTSFRHGVGTAPAELNELIDHLLEARRPRAAFQAVHVSFNDIETSRLKQLSHDVATVSAEP